MPVSGPEAPTLGLGPGVGFPRTDAPALPQEVLTNTALLPAPGSPALPGCRETLESAVGGHSKTHSTGLL